MTSLRRSTSAMAFRTSLCVAVAWLLLAPLAAQAQFGSASEGTVQFFVTHSGANHQGANELLDIVMDARLPQVTVTSPPFGAAVGGTAITISGTVADSVFDEFSGPEEGSVFGELYWQITNSGGIIGSGTVPILQGRFVVPDVPVGLGNHSYFLVARDGAGQTGSVFRSFVVADEPDIFLVGLEDGQAVTDESISLDIEFSADMTLVAYQGSADGRFFTAGVHEDVVSAPLSLGPNTFLFALNAGRNTYTKTFTIFRLASLEGPEITSIANQERTNQNPLTVEGTTPLGRSSSK